MDTPIKVRDRTGTRTHVEHVRTPGASSSDLRAEAEGMLSDMAFVLHLTRRLKAEIMEEKNRFEPALN